MNAPLVFFSFLFHQTHVGLESLHVFHQICSSRMVGSTSFFFLSHSKYGVFVLLEKDFVKIP